MEVWIRDCLHEVVLQEGVTVASLLVGADLQGK